MNYNRKNGFIESLISLFKIVIVFLLIQVYIETWVRSYKEKNWLKFILLSIIPSLMIGCVIGEMIERSEPKAHRDMFDAQMKAWERDNGL